MNLDLGYKSENGLSAAPADPETKSTIYYPSFSVQGKAAKAMQKALKAGQDVTANVQLKVVAVEERQGSSREYQSDDCRVEFEVTGMDIEGADMEEEDEETAEMAADKYFKKGEKAEGEDEESY